MPMNEAKILADAKAASELRSEADIVAAMKALYEKFAASAAPAERAACLLRVLGPQGVDDIQAFGICRAFETGDFRTLLASMYFASRLRFLRAWIGGGGDLNAGTGGYDSTQVSYLLHAAAANDVGLVARIAERHPGPARKGHGPTRVRCNLVGAMMAEDAARTGAAIADARALLGTKQPAFVVASTRLLVAILERDAREATVQLGLAIDAYPAAKALHEFFNPAGKLCPVPLLGIYKLARLNAAPVAAAMERRTEPRGWAGVMAFDEANGFRAMTDWITFEGDLGFLDDLVRDAPRTPG
jgi:hypothetical protein